MDPVANLKEQREIANRIVDGSIPEYALDPDAVRLAELVLTLDEWRMRGGFDPYGQEQRGIEHV